MPDEIMINHSEGLIEIRSFGTVTKEDIEVSISEILRLQEEAGFSKVVVDTTKQTSMPRTFHIFDLFSAFPRDIRFALIVDREQHSYRDIRFAETVSMNNNVSLRLFETREAALEWLK